jgi:hypothetical protein
MPYSIRKYKAGFRVCRKDIPGKCFSKKPLTKANAKKQMSAMHINVKESFNEAVSRILATLV